MAKQPTKKTPAKKPAAKAKPTAKRTRKLRSDSLAAIRERFRVAQAGLDVPTVPEAFASDAKDPVFIRSLNPVFITFLPTRQGAALIGVLRHDPALAIDIAALIQHIRDAGAEFVEIGECCLVRFVRNDKPVVLIGARELLFAPERTEGDKSVAAGRRAKLFFGQLGSSAVDCFA